MGKSNKNTKESFWSSHDFKVAILTAFVSIFVAYLTNHTLEEIEIQKYQYVLHESRFEKLQEALEYLVRFEVFDYEYINRLDVNASDFSEDEILEIAYESTSELNARIDALTPYFSEEALNTLVENGFFEHKLEYDDIDFSSAGDESKEIQEFLTSVNEQFDIVVQEIIYVIKADISRAYIPK